MKNLRQFAEFRIFYKKEIKKMNIFQQIKHPISETRIYSEDNNLVYLEREFKKSELRIRENIYNSFSKYYTLNNDSITPFIHFKENKDTITLGRDFVHGENLQSFLSSIRATSKSIITVLKRIAEVIGYIHDIDLPVVTLRASNIIIGHDLSVHLVDIGIEAIFFDQVSEKPGYENIILLSPEGFEHFPELSKKRDIFIYSHLICGLIYQDHPFNKKNLIKQMEQIKKHEPSIIGDNYPDLKELIYNGLSPVPDLRPSIWSFIDILTNQRIIPKKNVSTSHKVISFNDITFAVERRKTGKLTRFLSLSNMN